jgi:hypothetical protein
MSRRGEVKDFKDKIMLYSNLMSESLNAGVQDALVLREEAIKVMQEIEGDLDRWIGDGATGGLK